MFSSKTRWKLKCKKLERDADRFKHSGDQSANRSEQLVRELEALRSQHGTSAQQLDHLKRELNELLVSTIYYYKDLYILFSDKYFAV